MKTRTRGLSGSMSARSEGPPTSARSERSMIRGNTFTRTGTETDVLETIDERHKEKESLFSHLINFVSVSPPVLEEDEEDEGLYIADRRRRRSSDYHDGTWIQPRKEAEEELHEREELGIFGIFTLENLQQTLDLQPSARRMERDEDYD